MKSIYRAYTREISGVTHYFVKKYQCFPEFDDMPPVPAGMGMHKDFLKACELAGLEDENIIQTLMEELDLANVSGKVIPIRSISSEKISKAPSIFTLPQQWLSRLRWAHI